MKKILLIFLVFVWLFIVLSSEEQKLSFDHPEPSVKYELVGCQGKFHFVYTPHTDESIYREISNKLCKKESVCIVLFWNDRSYTPNHAQETMLPMTDDQVNKKVAHYNLNKNTGLDRLLLCNNGSCD